MPLPPGFRLSVHVAKVTSGDAEVDVQHLMEVMAQVLNEDMVKIAEMARQYAPESKNRPTGPFGGSVSGVQGGADRRLKDSIHPIPAQQEEGDSVGAGVGAGSKHAAPVEYGSGIFNSQKWRSRAMGNKTGRPYTAGRPNLRVVPGGEFRVHAAHARALAIPLPFKTPPSNTTEEDIYRRSHDKHGRPYVNAQGQPIMFSMWADNPGQEAQPYLRRALNRQIPGTRSRLRSVVAKGLHLKFKEIRVTLEVGLHR